MVIEFDTVYFEDGSTAGVVTVDTSDPAAQKTLQGLVDKTLDLNASGWGEISKHPGYEGKTRLDVLQAEVVRLNDAEGRKILGV